MLALRPLPDAVLVTGDIADGAFAEEYERAAELLAPLPMPVHALPGNHDDRDALREHFGAEPAWVDRARGAARRGVRHRDPGARRRAAGPRLARGAPRRRRADDRRDAPPAVRGRHPGAGRDRPPGRRPPRPGRAPRPPPVLRRVSPVTSTAAFDVLGGCGAVTCPSTHLASRLEIGATEYEIVREPPGFMLHVALDGEVVTHVQPVRALDHGGSPRLISSRSASWRSRLRSSGCGARRPRPAPRERHAEGDAAARRRGQPARLRAAALPRRTPRLTRAPAAGSCTSSASTPTATATSTWSSPTGTASRCAG